MSWDNYAQAPAPPVLVQVQITANSLAELRDKLREALGDLAPGAVVLPPAASTGPDPELVAQAAAAVADAAQAVAEKAAEAPAEAEKPKRTRKAKEAPGEPAQASAPPTEASSPESTAAPAVEEKAAPAEAPAEATPAAGSAVTHEQAKSAAEKFMAEHPDGKDVAKKEIRGYLATYGVARVAELAAKDLPSFMADLEGV